jgi:two-component system, NtrC family, sensor kinase
LLYSLTYNIANAYFNMNNMDSAMYYQRLVLEIEKSFGLNNYSGASLKNIGDIFYKKEELDSAKKYYLDALYLIKKKNTNANYLALTQAALADLYRKNGNNDSSLYYARAAVKNYTALGSFIQQTVGSYTTLSQSFKDNKQYDSAFFYMQMAKALSDSLNEKEIDRLSTFQQVGFNEQIRLKARESEQIAANNRKRTYLLLAGLGIFSIIAYILYRNNRQKQKANIVLQEQKQKVETTLQDLKATQKQLIQSEKMASLGELTAGIAHEIQNPLNFVNNFSEVSKELLVEMREAIVKGDTEEAKEIMNDVIQNLEKINHHGKRADGIVKGMLQHSRSSSATKELTDINKLTDEYLRLAYHGLRAKDKSFNAALKTDYDESIGGLSIIPQDIGRAILNLITNAFYAAPLPPEGGDKDPDYRHNPTVWVSTKKIGNKVEIRVRDNGPGIPKKILDKIFQPFFTTKPTGQGTGLGLSLSYDIVKAHGGELKVETKEGEGSEFIISLPG